MRHEADVVVVDIEAVVAFRYDRNLERMRARIIME
jgi:hypothetical protein